MLACVLLPDGDPELGARLFAVSPLVERAGEVVFLDVAGTSRLHGGTAGLFRAIRQALTPCEPRGMALASNRFTAEVGARYGGGPVAVARGEEALFLSRLPLAALPLGDELARRLLPLGLETLGDFASLPVAAVERRYGQRGVALHRLARGADTRGLLPERPPGCWELRGELPFPADRLDRLAPALAEALGRLVLRLVEEGRGLVRLGLDLRLEAGPPVHHELAPARPETAPELLLELVRLRIEQQPPGGPVTGFLLVVLESAPLASHQNGLFGEVSRDAARRAEALARLASVLGERAVRPPRSRPAHRLEDRWTHDEGPAPASPASTTSRAIRRADARIRGAREGREARREARDPRDAQGVTPALRLLREPEELVPQLAGSRIIGFRHGRRQHVVARLSPPRRLEGGWWSRPWARDEHDLLTAEGACLRICRDLCSRRWLLLGELD